MASETSMSSFMAACMRYRKRRQIHSNCHCLPVSIQAEKSQCDVYNIWVCVCVCVCECPKQGIRMLKETHMVTVLHQWKNVCTQHKKNSRQEWCCQYNFMNDPKKRIEKCGVRNGSAAPFHLHGLRPRLLLWWYFDVKYVFFSVFAEIFLSNYIFCLKFLFVHILFCFQIFC